MKLAHKLLFEEANCEWESSRIVFANVHNMNSEQHTATVRSKVSERIDTRNSNRMRMRMSVNESDCVDLNETATITCRNADWTQQITWAPKPENEKRRSAQRKTKFICGETTAINDRLIRRMNISKQAQKTIIFFIVLLCETPKHKH